MHVDHLRLQPLHHFRRIVAALAAGDDGDVGGRILPVQLRREPVGIGEFGRRRAKTRGRGRAERDDHDRLAGSELACDMRQRSQRLSAALRRQTGHAAENVAGRFRDLLDLVDRLGGEALLLRRRGLVGGRRAGRDRVSAARPAWCRTARPGPRACARAGEIRPAPAARVLRPRMQPAMRQTKKGQKDDWSAANSLTRNPQFCWAGPRWAASMTNFDSARPRQS